MAALVIGLAAALPCLAGAVGIGVLLGTTVPSTVGLEMAGYVLIGVKILSIAYGIGCQVLAAPET
jgi:hypothetical protein